MDKTQYTIHGSEITQSLQLVRGIHGCGVRCGNWAASSVTEAAENRDQENAGTHTQDTRP